MNYTSIIAYLFMSAIVLTLFHILSDWLDRRLKDIDNREKKIRYHYHYHLLRLCYKELYKTSKSYMLIKLIEDELLREKK